VIGVAAVTDVAELGLTEAEREHRVPPNVGLAATTLAKTRETWRPHGQLLNKHGFAHENMRRPLASVTAKCNEDKAKRFVAFFANDATPVESEAGAISEVTVRKELGPAIKPAPLQPEDFAIYHALRREHGERFARREEYLSGAALSVPRPSLVEIERDFIESQRFPARGPEFGEPPCVLGPSCCVIKLARKLGVAMDTPPPVLRMPDEIAAWERTGVLPNTGNGLCADDELKRLTRAAQEPPASLETTERALNRFTVRCEKGINSYSPTLQLPNVVHDTRRTGIVGFVPRYVEEFRQFRVMKRPGDPPGAPRIRVLADVSPNF